MFDLKPLAMRAVSAVVSGHALHQWGLRAMHEHHWRHAGLLFEAAALRYRRELDVDAIARLRVHELMAQVLSGNQPARAAELCVEVERRLSQLDRIESLEPPFALVEADSLLAGWLADSPDNGAHDELARAA